MDSFDSFLSTYNLERQLFRRMLMIIGMEADVSSRVIGFWLCLESMGHTDFIKKMVSHNDLTLTFAAAEAQAALAQIESVETANPSNNNHLTLISNIADHRFTLDQLYANRQAFHEALSPILDGVCIVIFQDILDERADQAQPQGQNRGELIGLVRPFGEGSSQQGTAAQGMEGLLGYPMFNPLLCGLPTVTSAGPVGPPVVLPIQSNLNPMAQPWNPELEQSVDQRTLFVTFSIGYPLSEAEIYEFFTGVYGDCIESIYVNHPRQGEGASLFGKVVFQSATTITYVMNSEEVLRLTAADKPLWCRRFDPRSQGRWRRRY